MAGRHRRTQFHRRRHRATARLSLAWMMALGVIVTVAWATAPIPPAGATISNVDPPQGGTLEPGDVVRLSVTTDAPCLKASADSSTYVVVTDNAGLCGQKNDRAIGITIITTELTPAGTHTVTLSETGSGGSETSWTFTIAAEESTTTTVATTTSTTVAAVTTTSAPVSTPPPDPTTTTTLGPTPTTSVPAPSTAGDTPEVADDDPGSSTTVPAADDDPATTTTTAATSDTTTDDGPLDDPGLLAAAGPGGPLPDAQQPESSPSELSGPGLGGFLSWFDRGPPPTLHGMDPDSFAALFGSGEERAERQASASGSFWPVAAMACVAGLLTFAGRRRVRGRT